MRKSRIIAINDRKVFVEQKKNVNFVLNVLCSCAILPYGKLTCGLSNWEELKLNSMKKIPWFWYKIHIQINTTFSFAGGPARFFTASKYP